MVLTKKEQMKKALELLPHFNGLTAVDVNEVFFYVKAYINELQIVEFNEKDYSRIAQECDLGCD
ncbi:hypothetical protein CVP05_03285 [Conservatibacter flavescens]|uniref:Uncharacterized protein n=1 Tax=Conservatibacter flavescens TaxID=28161 RepID=A0A2M8S532_9PAST|nr:hypothetical protein CVP05_03285 [Conservatibacter flavescens]